MKLIDLKTLAEQTSLSVQTHRKYLKSGMPHYKVGRKVLVDPDEVAIWFKRFRHDDFRPRKSAADILNSVLKELEADVS